MVEKKINRRNFIKTTSLTALGLMSKGVNTEGTITGSDRLIDCHVHINYENHDTESIIRWLDSVGVDKAWALPCENYGPESIGVWKDPDTERIWESYQKYPQRLVPFVSVDPRQKGFMDRLKKWHDAGCKGFGEHKVRLMLDNLDSMKIYEQVNEWGWAVLFHLDVPLPGFDDWMNPDIEELEKVARTFPKANFVGHGPGFWRYISGDAREDPNRYPKTRVVPGGKLPELLDTYSNIYCDLSAGSGLGAIQRDREFGIKFLKKYHKRIMYGTDYFGTDVFDSRHLDYLKSLNLDKEYTNYIFYKNAESLTE